MRVVCAPDSFKESISAVAAAGAMARGVCKARPDAQVDRCPIADGGEGTVAAMLEAVGGQAMRQRVTGPLGEPVEATWGLLADGTAVIEMAAAAGLSLVPAGQRDPTRTTTRGVGELIRAAVGAGCRSIVLGIGGSATTDAGLGMAQGLGVVFRDAAGRVIDEPLSGGQLQRVASIDLSGRLRLAPIVVACDVTNPLTGPRGAAAVYGPQKGARPDQIGLLEAGLGHAAELIRRSLGVDVDAVPGAGAAGGLGAGLIAFAGATLRPGIELVLDAVGFDRRVADADLCLTGEGRFDATSLAGKACVGVATRARRYGTPTIALVGAADRDQVTTSSGRPLLRIEVIAPQLPAVESMRRAAELIETAAAQAVGRWQGPRTPVES